MEPLAAGVAHRVGPGPLLSPAQVPVTTIAAVDGTAPRWRDEQVTRLLDGALIVGITAVGWAGMAATSPDANADAAAFTPLMAVVAAAVALPVWWRRQRPLGMLAAFLVGVIAAGAIDQPGLPPVQLAVEAPVLCFAIGAWSERLRAAAVGLVALIALIVLGAAGDGTNVLAAAAYGFALLALPAVAGYATRTRRRYLEEVEQRLADAERDRDERARRAVLDERTRIARELHDVVAHHVSLIGVQAGAARLALDGSPEATRAALEAIDASSRTAVGEMRQLLDALAPLPGDADVDGGGAHPPQPSLAGLDELVARWNAAGVPIQLERTGDVDALSPALSLCCYRIVEEALTNVARHAAGRTGAVVVAVGPDAVTIAVTNPGPPPSPHAPPRPAAAAEGTGRGLVGMRERVALFGGELVAGPTDEGGFAVRATLPRDAP